jgi:diguanylate cyclase (GGDEF)-like protein
MTDSLTKLFNRRYFDISLTKELRRAIRYQKKVSVAMLDLDHFKKLNDTYGHVFGDQVLIQFADTVQNNLRQEDIACRYGGEEFVLLLPEVSASGAFCLLERIREKIKTTPFFTEKAITFSAGVACFPQHISNDEQSGIVEAADNALYQAKHAGRDRIIEYASVAKEEDQGDKESVWDIRYERDSENTRLILKNCHTQNISRYGARFETDMLLHLNEVLRVVIDNRNKKTTCSLEGALTQAERIADNRFSYGLKFEDLTQKQNNLLDKISRSPYLPY